MESMMKFINSFPDYDQQVKVDYLAWQWFARAAGFWTWFALSIYLWYCNKQSLDIATTIGLVVGIVVWGSTKFIQLVLGSRIISTNLWEFGCGCLVRTIAIELFQYLAIAAFSIIAFRLGELSLASAIIFSIIGILNWFFVSLKNV
jgi:hypothetical protein